MSWNYEDTIWLAGLLDGESWIGITRTTDYRTMRISYHPSVEVHMTDEKTIERICEITGIGTYNSYQPNNENAKRKYCWGAQRFGVVEEILQRVLPYLFTKKDQAKMVMEFIEQKKTLKILRHGHKRTNIEYEKDNKYYLILKSMNKRGV